LNPQQPPPAQPGGALPPRIRTFMIVISVLNAIAAALFLMVGDTTSFFWTVVGTAAICGCYFMLTRRKNWARIALVILTFPIGLMLLGEDSRKYCRSSKE